ncbi:MAG: MG2 domain-containing protein [Alsobacter sp.]
MTATPFRVLTRRWLAPIAFAALVVAGTSPAGAQPAPTPASVTFDVLKRADGARMVPELFLRRWDPITLFFDRDTGPAGGGPEDAPDRVVTLQPPQAGAWQWLDARTLQFRPADPWTPLQTVRVKARGAETALVPLLPMPTGSSPTDKADGIAGLDQIGLTFSEPVDTAVLARLLSIEIRPQPGIVAGQGQTLTAQDFTIKPLERAARSDAQTYLVVLRQPVPDGRMAILRLKLSDTPGLDEPHYELRLRSAVPFAITDTTCGRKLDRSVADGVLRCAPEFFSADDGAPAPSVRRTLVLAFSGEPETLDIIRAREALRISPAVDDLAVERDGQRLRIAGKFLADTVYTLRVVPGSIKDSRSRPLVGEVFEQRFAFAPDKPSLRWDASQGIVERLGPQMVPLRGRGYAKADIRIHAIDPLSRDFQAFPADGLTTEDDEAPVLPGNEPKRWTGKDEIAGDAMAARVKAMGSPAVSELLELPLQRGGADAKFGLDLKSLLARIAGAGQAGTYLVGLRAVDESQRRWVRLQVTDLSLTAVEETERVRFVVTSLATARPVEGAEIRLEGVKGDGYVTLARGTTTPDGGFNWLLATRAEAELRRIVVVKGTDTLVLEPDRGPSQYAQENWTKPEETWLGWTVDPKAARAEEDKLLCHLFTERPIYRPEEPVHIKGMVRLWKGGALSYSRGKGTLVITGPSDQEWRIAVTPDEVGGIYHRFDVQTTATGDYNIRFEPDGPKPKKAEGEESEAGEADAVETTRCGEAPFKKEAYRLPTFEAVLNAPQTVPLDGEFSVDLVARYFAGGLVAERPIKWRVTQFPQAWTPPGRDGFLFSSDQRFSGEAKFRSTPVLEREAKTDAGGSARLTLDPTIEPTAQPRRYAIEATVTADDDIQVRATANVTALPPFVLGVKVPRYLQQAGSIAPEIIAVDGAGQPREGLALTARLIKRNWISVLQASDYSQGAAKYVTQVVDETVAEEKITSGKDATSLTFAARDAGVYMVEVEAADRVGRRQRVSVDLFMGGDTPVTWSRAPAQTVTVTTEKDAYAPGETATLVIQSPFQTARALAIIEEPDGRFGMEWVDIANGFGRLAVTVRKPQMPRLAVHVLVMRGRLPGEPGPTAPFDQGKPVTVAATKWLTVTPVKHIVVASLDAPQKARPGQEVEVTLRLADDTGKPVAGEATFWMVDQAVLSLARERPLDPLPSFVVARPTTMAARDTRNMAFGIIPLEEVPGGDEATDDWGVENISVRKNFTPVPIYLPRVPVGADGVAKIKVKLPDSLTVFKLRAKAISGPDRFGFATGEMLIRQEVVAQPALPRFVRPGDRFEAGLIGRIIEGPGGTGRVALSAEGVTVEGAREQALAWQQNRPARVDFQVTAGEMRPGQDKARLRFVLQRDADKSGDALQIDLPIRPDRPALRRQEIADIAPGASLTLAAPTEPVRAGSWSRAVTVAADPSVVRLVAGLNYLAEYPFGCTEQRIALSSATLAMKPFTPILQAAGLDGRISSDVRATVRAIEQAIDDDGLVAFWPRGKGTVSLTAWAYTFIAAADKAGETVDPALKERLGKILKQALRSDFPRFVGGEALRERVEALTALGEGGALDDAYVAELGRRSDALSTLSLAQATAAAAKTAGEDRRMVGGMVDALWSRVSILQRNGRPVYAGIAGERANPLILPSEVRTVSEIARAVAIASPDDARLPVLREGLMRLGEGSGWGSTNANAAAIRALAASWRRPAAAIPVGFTRPDGKETVTLASANPVGRRVATTPASLVLDNGGRTAVVALVDSRWQPQEPGWRAAPVAQGFVVTRTLSRVPAGTAPQERLVPDAEQALRLTVGDVVEEIAEVVVPEDRTHVAIRLPIAAGMEPLNPALATAPAEAQPSGGPTLAPSWVSFQDDYVLYAYDRLPKGTYRFVFRTRAQVAGQFTQPPGEAELMYQAGVYGASAGQRLVVTR